MARLLKFLGIIGGKPSPWLYLFLVTALLSMGCNFATMTYFLLPWMDDKAPPKVPLTTDKKEVTVVIQASFAQPLEAQPEFIPEFQTVDRDLCDRLGQALKKRYEENRDRIKIIPYYQVRSFINKNGDSRLVSPHEIGKHFNADYVINLEINGMSFYESGSSKQLFRGKTELSVTVFDMTRPREEGPMADEAYRTEYPSSGPIDAGNSSVIQFRGLFLTRVAKDLSRLFAAAQRDERGEFD